MFGRKNKEKKIEEMERMKTIKNMEHSESSPTPKVSMKKKLLGQMSKNVFDKVKIPEQDGTSFHVKEDTTFLSKLLGIRLFKTLTKRKKKDDSVEQLQFISKKEVRINVLGRKFIFKKKNALIIFLNAILVSGILAINFLMLKDAATLFSTINIIAIFIFVFPIILMRYSEFKEKKELEDMFPIFLRDFVESTRGGMTLPYAFKALTRNDYKALNPYINKIAIQLNWGIPVDKVLLSFARKTESPLIMRTVASVIESHRFGGNLSDTFEALSRTAVEVDRLREERRLYMNSQIITGYIIFFVFLAVMIGLQTFLVPSLADTATGGVFTPGGEEIDTSNLAVEFETIFRNLILIQGLFAGLSVGKMAEGSIVSGTKHSLFMMFVGFIVFTLAG